LFANAAFTSKTELNTTAVNNFFIVIFLSGV